MDFLSWASANEELTVVGLVAMSLVSVFVIRVLCSSVRQVWIGQQQLTLKQSMIDQGMSVDEITEVMKA